MTTYFQQLSDRCDALTEKADNYLDKLPSIPNDEVCRRIYDAAQKLFSAANENFDAVPEWVQQTMDCNIPYSTLPRNGSLRYTLGFSVASQDAHLRNLLEIAEGRETKELDFPVLAEL